MGNVLEFALGLQTSEFLSKLGFASEEILSLAGLAELVRSAWDKTWEAMAKGAELKALSSATGESVKNLYAFEHGLEAIGGQSQSLAMFFMLTQKALSGVNEAGQRTDMMFSALGLNIGKLRSQDTVKTITDIAGALNKLNPTQAAGIAESMFGRFQAQSILQIARNMDLFKSGIGESANTGALLDKFAKTFELVKADWGDIQSDVLGIWTAVAGAIAPELQKIFETVHGEIKDIGPELAGAIEGGHVQELLSDAGAAALEAIGIYGTKVFDVMAISFGDALATAIQIAIEDAGMHGVKKIKAELQAGAALLAMNSLQVELDDAQRDYNNAKNPAAKHAAAEHLKRTAAAIANDQAFISGLGTANDADYRKRLADALQNTSALVSQMMADTSSAWSGGKFSGPAMKKFLEDLKRLKGIGLAGENGTTSPGAGGTTLGGLTENHFRPEFTALEKMGFVMRGAGHIDLQQRQTDLLQTIANNTTPRNAPSGTGGAPNPVMGDWGILPAVQNTL